MLFDTMDDVTDVSNMKLKLSKHKGIVYYGYSRYKSQQEGFITLDKYMKCRTCGKKFTSKTYMKNHVQEHEQEFRLSCAFCYSGFSHLHLLYKHTLTCNKYSTEKHKKLLTSILSCPIASRFVLPKVYNLQRNKTCKKKQSSSSIKTAVLEQQVETSSTSIQPEEELETAVNTLVEILNNTQSIV